MDNHTKRIKILLDFMNCPIKSKELPTSQKHRTIMYNFLGKYGHLDRHPFHKHINEIDLDKGSKDLCNIASVIAHMNTAMR